MAGGPRGEPGVLLQRPREESGHPILNLDIAYSPAEDFSQAAAAAVSQWTYEPATLDGKPARVFIITVEFHLSE